jgi:hypothetical protein
VEATTGPLGQSFANAVRMAIAEAQLAARYNRPGFDVIDHATSIVSDEFRRPSSPGRARGGIQSCTLAC